MPGGLPGEDVEASIWLVHYTCSQTFKKICAWEILGANVLKSLWIEIENKSSSTTLLAYGCI